jgi:hypothetical protein
MACRVLLLWCKVRNETFEPKEDQPSAFPWVIDPCPKCGQSHSYTRDEVSGVRDFQSDSLVGK